MGVWFWFLILSYLMEMKKDAETRRLAACEKITLLNSKGVFVQPASGS